MKIKDFIKQANLDSMIFGIPFEESAKNLLAELAEKDGIACEAEIIKAYNKYLFSIGITDFYSVEK
jgi:hypothetical protein